MEGFSEKTRRAIESCVEGLCDSGERLDRRTLTAQIRRDFAVIRREYEQLSKNGIPSPMPLPLVWLWDNFYLIEGAFEDFLIASRHFPRLPAYDGVPRLFRAVAALTSELQHPLDDSTVSELLSVLDNRCGFTLREYFTAREVVSASLIRRCSEAFIAYRKGESEEECADTLGIAIDTLRTVSTHDFGADALLGRCSQILSRDPSGAFDGMTIETRLTYLSMLCELSEKRGISERTLAKKLLESARSAAKDRERHIGFPLFAYPKKRGVLYLSVIIGFSTAITVLLSVLVSPFCLLAYFPIWEAVKHAVDLIFSFFIRTRPLPRMEVDSIPPDGALLVVITSLLCGEKKDAALFERLERMYNACGEENVFFGLLADLPDSKSARAPGDEEILGYAYGRIEALCKKHGNKFLLLERRRSWSKSEECFMGRERKRGAVCELAALLRGRSTTFSERSETDARLILSGKRIKYVVTLDSDTNLPIGALREMYGAMTHPLAIPTVDAERGVVTEGYGIMQPRCSTDIESARATPFARLMCGTGGREPYSDAAFEVYQSIFGEGIFCGKGIFDVDAFDKVINLTNPFPEDRILSHDCLEGARLRTALINDLVLTDGFPKNELSYTKRRHRWIRGDVQNLPFIGRYITNASGARVRNGIGNLSKFKLFDNLRCALLPIFAYISVMLCAFCRDGVRQVLAALALSYILLPIICEAALSLSRLTISCSKRRFFSRGVSAGLVSPFLRAVYLLCELPTSALSSLDAVLRSLFRMLVSGKSLLEWQTAQQSDAGSSGLLLFVYRTIFSAFSGFLLFAFSPGGILRLISLMWLCFPVIAYHTSFDRPIKGRRRSSSGIYRRYARDIWRFFEELVTEKESFLPPDNIGFYPEPRLARRTSPTNIGLYLLSTLAARDFGFITTSELYKRVSDTVKTLEGLEKYRGHLYNWYSTADCSVLSPRYISTVDSGNLTACLIALKEGLRDYVYESTELLELILRVESLCEETDYSFLYDRSRSLFLLGATVKEDGKASCDGGVFDLLMSEARTLSYIECARRNVPIKHWSSLSRPIISGGGYIGLASWTGTAFEYLMPALFLPTHSGSLCLEALSFAVRAQKRRRAVYRGKRLWGISESGYYALDGDGNYCYRAFGVPSLGLCSGLGRELVISPYSSFLSLCVDEEASLQNLSALEHCGLYGKYGFYEALDLTEYRVGNEGGIVKSFMSHHLGMSMCALCNAALDMAIVRRFMRDGRMRCAEELLCEKIPVNAAVRRRRRRNSPPKRPRENDNAVKSPSN